MAIDKSAFYRQFILTKHRERVPVSWRSVHLGKWILGHHNSLRTQPLVDSSEKFVGCALGFAVSPKCGKLEHEMRLPIMCFSEGWISQLDQFLGSMSGAFAVFVVEGEGVRVMPDAGGRLPIVYDTCSKSAASSALLLDSSGLKREALYKLEIEARGPGYFPFGLTAYEGVRRLLPNHTLFLPSGNLKRCWPPPLPRVLSLETVARRIIKCISLLMIKIGELYPVVLGLTGGIDSRVILACAHKSLARNSLSLFTLDTDEEDVRIARRISKILEIPHRVIHVSPASPASSLRWLHETGFSVVRRPNARQEVARSAARAKLQRNAIIITGGGGESARKQFWRDGDDFSTNLGNGKLLERIGLPRLEEFVTAEDNWQSGLPKLDTFQILDLAYMEQDMASWAGALQNGTRRNLPTIVPFCQRSIFESIMKLAEFHRSKSELHQRILQLVCPELQDVPFR